MRQNRSVIHYKYMQCIVCQLYVNKAVFENLTHLEWEGSEGVFLNIWLLEKPVFCFPVN